MIVGFQKGSNSTEKRYKFQHVGEQAGNAMLLLFVMKINDFQGLKNLNIDKKSVKN